MPTDTLAIARRLAAFYDFTGKSVLDIGAGGGQLVEYARAARHVLAIDPDAAALDRLAQRLGEHGLADRFTLRQAPLLDVTATADVALFEFSLHQMEDPGKALAHARPLAADLVVLDHAPGSPWSWCAAEEERVAAGWAAVGRWEVRRRKDVAGRQEFCDFAALRARLAGCGPESRRRIEAYESAGPIVIPMPYRLVVL